MGSSESKTQLLVHHQQQQQQQHPPDDDDTLLQLLAQDLQNLLISQAIDHRQLLEVDPEVVLQSQITCTNHNKDVKIQDESESSSEIDDGNNREHAQDLENHTLNGPSQNGGGAKSKGAYPLRPDADDCSYYMRTRVCKYGSNCKFNHPPRIKIKPAKETKKQKEENMERHGQIDCKYHSSSTGCKYGKACKFNHGRGKTVKTPVVDFNFLDLPIRPGEKECPYYMRNGSCKYGPSCRFNHPDPTAVDALPLQPAPEPNISTKPSGSAPRIPGPAAAFVPMMYPPPQNMPPLDPDWNAVYQAFGAHAYPSSEGGLPIPPAFFLHNPPPSDPEPPPSMSVPEYPERPGRPDCSHFMKTGVCKYRASCKFHHPKNRSSRDQNICSYFSKHGICKYGAACKYEHHRRPIVNYSSSSSNSIPAAAAAAAGEG